MDFYDKLIDLRITLASKCDGFSVKDASKSLILSSKIKILYLLKDRDMTQGDLIDSIAMAKSNLANLLKTMIHDGLIVNYKNEGNARNIYYKITPLGETRLNEYKSALRVVFSSVCTCPDGRMENSVDELLNMLKGRNNND